MASILGNGGGRRGGDIAWQHTRRIREPAGATCWVGSRLPYVETEVPVLVARDASGAPLVVLFSYGCHPVCAGAQTQFDPDYPGRAVARIEEASGAFAPFVLGPAGDQDPVGGRDWEASGSVVTPWPTA